ncbi:sensor histidine kinase [Maritimibacter dapengensis]|uniref:histidine kinase n=1 Tax=Maritimibacter dapengensis TaxID=2836868 RepID=A0ABS6T2K7_9RHOB|nr:ATP-binding protein [Maritimibacter dapengensis]MBV7379452.1 PAS domain-containing protein [Maritimibacter dapengensis]
MDRNHFLSAIPIPAAWIGPNDRIDAMNPQAVALFSEAVLGRHYATVFRQPALLGAIETALDEGRATHGRHAMLRVGRERNYDVLVTPMSRGAEGLILTFEDITAAEQAGEMRSEFVANVSHELRTPLTAISGFIETLRGPARDDSDARAQFLEIMERETRRMHRLVDDLLSLAKVEDTEGQRPTDTVDVAGLLTSVARSFGPKAEERGVEIVLDGCAAPVVVPGDSDQLTQVFNNLVENAIKYGGSGGIVTIALEQVGHDPRLRGPGVIIRVEDKGDGIDDRHLGRLTERFYRVDTHRSRGMGGTGLGLAIVKHIINRHRGRLRITSEPGQGSRFEVALPVA